MRAYPMNGLFYIDEHPYTKREVWDWLKAENHYRPPKEKLTVVPNRAARRRMSKNWKRIEAAA